MRLYIVTRASKSIFIPVGVPRLQLLGFYIVSSQEPAPQAPRTSQHPSDRNSISLPPRNKLKMLMNHPKTFLALLAATTYLPSSTLACIFFNATLHDGANQANSAQEAVALAQQKSSSSQLGDPRLDVYFWDNSNNDDIVEPLKDAVCTGIDLKPYAENSWVVPCTPVEKQVELDIVYDPDITSGGVLVNIFKYQNAKVQAEKFNDPDKDLIYTFSTESQDDQGQFFEGKISCDDCESSAGQPLKC
ncbi:hypothetical protein BST61_g6269 [Cercospora zeina]